MCCLLCAACTVAKHPNPIGPNLTPLHFPVTLQLPNKHLLPTSCYSLPPSNCVPVLALLPCITYLHVLAVPNFQIKSSCKSAANLPLASLLPSLSSSCLLSTLSSLQPCLCIYPCILLLSSPSQFQPSFAQYLPCFSTLIYALKKSFLSTLCLYNDFNVAITVLVCTSISIYCFLLSSLLLR